MSFMKRRAKYQNDPDFHFFVESLVKTLNHYDFTVDEISEILRCTEEVYAEMKGEIIFSEPKKVKVWKDDTGGPGISRST